MPTSIARPSSVAVSVRTDFRSLGYRDVDGANITAKQELIAKMVGATASTAYDGTQNHTQTKQVC